MLKKMISSVILTTFSMSAVAQSSYIVKKGDTLSEIVSRYTSPPPPLYGKQGRMESVRKLNP
jgi:hypothetical protein